MDANLIVEHARLLEGVKYKHQGRRPKLGLDCVGVVRHIAAQQGVSLVDWCRYPLGGSSAKLLEKLAENGFEEKPVETAEPGDLLLFRRRPQAAPTHMAVLLDDGTFLHASDRTRKVTREVLRSEHSAYLHSAWRFPD